MLWLMVEAARPSKELSDAKAACHPTGEAPAGPSRTLRSSLRLLL